MAIDSAGRLIVVGYNTSGVWLVACYSRSTGTGPELRKRRPRTDGFPRYAVARAVAVAANGDIVVAGHYSSVNGAPLALARYTSQGVLLWTVATTFTDPAIIDGPTGTRPMPSASIPRAASWWRRVETVPELRWPRPADCAGSL